MDFTRINQVGLLEALLPFKKLSELELQKDYRVTALKNSQTRWGSRFVMDLDNQCSCYLPERFVKVFEDASELFKQMSEAAANNNLIMQYHGTKFNKIEFKNAKE